MSDDNHQYGICLSCKRYMPIKAKKMCQNCWHKYKRKFDINFFLRTRYTEIKQRCSNIKNKNSNIYYGMKICSLDEFLKKFQLNSDFISLMREWQKSDFQPSLAPSIDRIDNNQGYEIENLQFITHGQNARKDSRRLLIDVFTRDNNFIGRFDSLNAAVEYTNVQQSNAWKVLNNKRKHTGGYIFKLVGVINES